MSEEPRTVRPEEMYPAEQGQLVDTSQQYPENNSELGRTQCGLDETPANAAQAAWQRAERKRLGLD